MENTTSYQIVCYLEGEHYERVRMIQEKLFELTGSHKCLDSWSPHLTIGSGILVPLEQKSTMENAFEKLTANQKPFTIHLKGFEGISNWKGAKEGVLTPYVLWINVAMNDDLMNLFKQVASTITDQYETWWSRITESDYSPHVTVAYGDLSAEGYAAGMNYLKTLNFEDAITISHIALVEYTPDKDTEYKRFYFGG